MPSSEAEEIEEALQRGFQLSDLRVCDWTPAVVQKLRKKYSGVVAYAMPIQDAFEQLALEQESLCGAVIDLCSPLAPEVVRNLRRCGAASVWVTGALLVVNVLRGRHENALLRAPPETHARTKAAWQANQGLQLTPTDFDRSYSLQQLFPDASLLELRPYKSGTTVFLTAVFQVT